MKIESYAKCELPTEFGSFDLELFRGPEDESEALLISAGELSAADAPFVRLHSECFTGETLLSLKCDCRAQLETALRTIRHEGVGAVVYLRQEGRGIGLGNKLRAYAEQARGANTIEANHRLGFPTDLRDFTLATEILKLKDLGRIRLHTNNPDKIAAVKAAGIEIESVIPAPSQVNDHNLDYLRTKLEKMGHEGLAESPGL